MELYYDNLTNYSVKYIELVLYINFWTHSNNLNEKFDHEDTEKENIGCIKFFRKIFISWVFVQSKTYCVNDYRNSN